jgi:hypothetical protein
MSNEDDEDIDGPGEPEHAVWELRDAGFICIPHFLTEGETSPSEEDPNLTLDEVSDLARATLREHCHENRTGPYYLQGWHWPDEMEKEDPEWFKIDAVSALSILKADARTERFQFRILLEEMWTAIEPYNR